MATVQIARWTFSVRDYARMCLAGIFSENDRVELLEGEIRMCVPSVHAMRPL